MGRKALADKTKGTCRNPVVFEMIQRVVVLLEFKKLPDGEKANAFKGLLKGE